MTNFTTITKSKHFIQYLLVALLLFAFTSVSCADTPTDSLNKDSQKYLSFYENVDGEKIHWEANFFRDEITSIYKNGKRIPDDLVADYKDKVYDQLDEMRFGGKRFSIQMPVIVGDDFNLSMDDLQKELEEMKKNLPKPNEEFNIEEFKKEMEELKKELEENKSHIYKFKFDEEKFKEEMKELQKNLKDHPIKLENLNYFFDWEEENGEV